MVGEDRRGKVFLRSGREGWGQRKKEGRGSFNTIEKNWKIPSDVFSVTSKDKKKEG